LTAQREASIVAAVPPSEQLEHVPEAPGRIREAHMLEMVFPSQTNHYGTLFGGQALAFMDKAAFVAASRFTRLTMVTASSERIDFHVPVRQGQVADLMARVTATGRTSVTVTVELHAEDLLTGERHLATRGRFVLVAVDSTGKPIPVPPLDE
jgi:acyl-CoA hydrolase